MWQLSGDYSGSGNLKLNLSFLYVCMGDVCVYARYTRKRFLKSVISTLGQWSYNAGGMSIRVKGVQARREEAAILVLAPHSTFLDSVIVYVTNMCSVMVRKESMDNYAGSKFAITRQTKPKIYVYKFTRKLLFTFTKPFSSRKLSVGRLSYEINVIIINFCLNSCIYRGRLSFRLDGLQNTIYSLNWNVQMSSFKRIHVVFICILLFC